MGRLHRRLFFSELSLVRERQRGFSLIELLVVIAVLGVLVSVLVIAVNPLKQLQKGRDTKRKANIAQIQASLELYRADQGQYPLPLYPVSSPCSASLTGTVAGSTVTYLQRIPCDPTGTNVVYTYNRTSPTSYTLTACLENSSDPDIVSGSTCAAGRYHYIVPNP